MNETQEDGWSQIDWMPIEVRDGHTWEINEATQQFRIDGQILEGGPALSKMLKTCGLELTAAEATELFITFLNSRIPPGSGKTSSVYD